MRRNWLAMVAAVAAIVWAGDRLRAESVVTRATTEINIVADDAEWVVFLHGLARSGKSMRKAAKAFGEAGFNTCVVDYPSTTADIATLARESVSPAIVDCVPEGVAAHFVTHSMGGIMVRQIAHDALPPDIGRVVMLAPPNQGSEVVDSIRHWRAFDAVNGPAGGELGTDDDSVPNRLGPVSFETGVIAGTRSINWINSSTMIEGKDDGKVSVERTQVEGMSDFRVVPATHTFIMKKRNVIELAIRFIATGEFGEEDE